MGALVIISVSLEDQPTRSTNSELQEHSQQRPTKDGGPPGKRQRWHLLTDTNVVGVCPIVSSWMRDEPIGPRSRS